MHTHICMHLIEGRQTIVCACSGSRVVGEMELENRMHVCSKRETPISSCLPPLVQTLNMADRILENPISSQSLEPPGTTLNS